MLPETAIDRLVERALAGPGLTVVVAGPGWGKDRLARLLTVRGARHLADPDAGRLAMGTAEPGRVVATSRDRALAAIAAPLLMDGQALVLDELDLAANLEDWRALLAALGASKPDAAAREALARTGGWPAALGLARLIAARRGPDGIVESLVPDEPVVRAYLEHGLAGAGDLLPALEALSIAPYATAALAEAALPGEGRRALERLVEGSWLAPDPRPGAWRLHPLARAHLAGQLEARLGAAQAARLRERVADALDSEGNLEEALVLLAGGRAWTAYAERLERGGASLLRSGGAARVRAAISRLPASERERAGLHQLEGQVAQAGGDLERALDCYARAESAATSPEARVRAVNAQGAALSQRGQYAAALARFRAALTDLAGLERSALVGDVRNNTGITWLRLGRSADALRAFREAARAYRAAAEPEREALTLHNLGVAHQERGEFREAERAYEDALKLKRQAGMRSRIGTTLVNLAELRRHLGEPALARPLLEEASELARDDGDPAGEAYATVNLADLDLDAGENERAGRGYRAALALLEDGEDAHAAAQARLGLARLHRLEGRLDGARAALAAADPDEAGSAHALESGLLLATAGEREAAEAAFSAAAASAREREASFDLASALLHRARLTGSETDAREGLELCRRLGYAALAAMLAPAAPPETTGARLYLLGRFGLRLPDGTEHGLDDLPTRKAALVLAHLALAGRPLPKEAVADAYWPDARNPTGSLDTALYHLRALLGRDAVRSGKGMVGLAMPLEVDATMLLAQAERLRGHQSPPLAAIEAVRAAYGGPLLPEFPGELEPERRAVEAAAVDALERLARAYQDAGRGEDAAGVWHDLLRVDPYHTGAHESLVEHYEASGQASRAGRQKELLATALAELAG